MILPVGTVLPWISALVIIPIEMPALFDKIFCRVQVFLLSGDAVKFHQTHLHHLMAGCYMLFVMAEDRTNQVCILKRDVEQVSFSSSLEVRSRSFIKVTGVVKLVAHLPLFFPPLLARPFVGCFRIYCAGSIKI